MKVKVIGAIAFVLFCLFFATLFLDNQKRPFANAADSLADDEKPQRP